MRAISLGVLLIPFSLITQSAARGGDWPQFLGPQRNGVSPETGLLQSLSADSAKTVWKTPLGVGMSGIAISGNIACTLYQTDTEQFAVALDAKTGKPIWQTPLAPACMNSMGNGPLRDAIRRQRQSLRLHRRRDSCRPEPQRRQTALVRQCPRFARWQTQRIRLLLQPTRRRQTGTCSVRYHFGPDGRMEYRLRQTRMESRQRQCRILLTHPHHTRRTTAGRRV